MRFFNKKHFNSDLLTAKIILIISGWRLVSVYGHPTKLYDSTGTSIDYLITSGDGTIVDIGNYFGEEYGWMLSGIKPSKYPDYRVVKMWKPLVKEKHWSFYACSNHNNHPNEDRG